MPFTTKFKIEQLDDKYFKLIDDLVFISEKHNLKIRVPAGFVSDGPSVPRAPLLYLFFGHVGKRAAVIHDWLYRNALVPRDVADSIYKEALIDSKKGKNVAFWMHLGVRLGGASEFGSRPGCLDVRYYCDKRCQTCKDSFSAYKLSCVYRNKE